MEIKIIDSDKKDFFYLLLKKAADEQENRIDKYPDRGEVFALLTTDKKVSAL